MPPRSTSLPRIHIPTEGKPFVHLHWVRRALEAPRTVSDTVCQIRQTDGELTETEEGSSKIHLKIKPREELKPPQRADRAVI